MKRKISSKENVSKGKTTPIKNAEDVKKSKDEKIDQDFPGFPHLPSTPGVIKSSKEKKPNTG